MKIITTFPPNIEEIREKFGELPHTAVFTYGDTIYNPSSGFIDTYLLTHEETHQVQQGDNPREWWRKYLADNKFRLDQEVSAYKNQYHHFCRNKKDPFKADKFLEIISSHLASSMYGNIITQDEAKNLIKS